MNTDLDLDSSVEVVFKSDYLPLNRLASNDQVARIQANTRNPEAEAAAAATERTQRSAAAATSDTARRASVERRLTPSQPAPPRPGEAGTVQDADQARREAAAPGGRHVEQQTQPRPPAQPPPAQPPAAQPPAAQPPAAQPPAQPPPAQPPARPPAQPPPAQPPVAPR